MPFASIVVPVFNGHDFLDTCMGSILGQTYRDFEVVLVDDGSTDGTLELAQMWAQRDARVRICASRHQGLVASRRTGVLAAKGKYIAFVDADDWIEENWLAEFVRPVEADGSIDIAVGGYVWEEAGGRILGVPRPSEPRYVAKLDMLTRLFTGPLEGGGAMCMKLYRRELLCRISYREDVSVGEDIVTNWELFRLAERIYDIGRGRYHYVYNPKSMTHAVNPSAYRRFYVFLSDVLHADEVIQSPTLHKAVWERVLHDWHRLISTLYYETPTNEHVIRRLHRFFLRHFPDFFKALPATPFIQYEMRRFDSDEGEDAYDRYAAEWEKLQSYRLAGKRLFLYGTGIHSRSVKGELERRGLSFDGYVVSDGASPAALPKEDAHPVLPYSKLRADEKKDTVLFLAMRTQTSSVIYDRIAHDGFLDIVLW